MQFIRPRQVLEMIGVSRSTLWRMIQAGTFPPPVCITERNRGFVLDAVEGWMKARAESAPYYPEVATARRRGRASHSAASELLRGAARGAGG
jgi:prophage regulatory protein